MYNNAFDIARAELNNALQICHQDSTKNQQRILRYLIPVEMIIGNYPTEALLEKFELKSEYGDIVKAVVAGNLSAFERAIEQNNDSFL